MTISFRDNIEKMSGYTPGFQPADLSAVKLNTNENPYPPSPRVIAALRNLEPELLRRYPPQRWDAFRTAAAEVFGVDPEMIVCGNGADEILTILVRCCCDRDRPLAYPVLTYSLYPELARIQDCPVLEVPFDDYGNIPPRLYETGAALTILCNPNAPTGTFIAPQQVAQLAGRLSGVLLVDEAYVDFAETNCLHLLDACDNLVILRSMSKAYSLAGMRFGFAVASRRIVAAMLKVKDSYNVNIAAQVAALAAIKDQDYCHANVRRITAQRERLITALRRMGLEPGDSHTNFILVKFTRPPAREVYEKLCARNIYVRHFPQPELADKLRISVGSEQQNDTLLDALREILQPA